ncbi:glycosyltransferase family 2 protein [Caenispirillum bisanense]|uniref:Glycosyltransferase 2-like domain-containing protein n=1 Tax=Caenispirillum bisanense TaxID=414052 RepID=A0A286GUK7_9PROT|nr:glycosyltransferase family 2 protein [Caenispirillum bisanense]SOD98799.1 hypothetical protein SAMN05421508_10888 [Caenispirillum bisanense]
MTGPAVEAAPLILDVSVVVFRPDETLLAATLRSLADAVGPDLPGPAVRLYLVDNGPDDNRALLDRAAAPVRAAGVTVDVLAGHGNVGYGRGHDLAIRRPDPAPYHLVLNPDVVIAPDALRQGIGYLDRHSTVAMVAPRVETPSGTFEPLCKRYPDVVTLALRGFAPAAVRRLFGRRLARYEMRDVLGPQTVDPVPGIVIASGCFMLMRSAAARAVGGFGDAYFLYFEDFDLSLRLAQAGGIVYLPAMRIVHHGGNTARKGAAHVRLFLRSAVTFFRRNGLRGPKGLRFPSGSTPPR